MIYCEIFASDNCNPFFAIFKAKIADLSFGDKFYCKKNNNPYYHWYTDRSPQWNVPKDKIFQIHTTNVATVVNVLVLKNSAVLKKLKSLHYVISKTESGDQFGSNFNQDSDTEVASTIGSNIDFQLLDEKYIFCEYKGPSTGWASGSELKIHIKKSKTRTSSSCDIERKIINITEKLPLKNIAILLRSSHHDIFFQEIIIKFAQT